VVDTRQLSMAQGFMVLEAAKLAKNAYSREEIINRALNVGERVHLFGALSTLKYLAMSGRVGHLTAGTFWEDTRANGHYPRCRLRTSARI